MNDLDIINDSEFLNVDFIVSKNDLLTKLPFNLNLINRLYNKDVDFNEDELVKLIKQLDYLGNKNLEYIIFVCIDKKFYIRKELNDNLIRLYDDIFFEFDIAKRLLGDCLYKITKQFEIQIPYDRLIVFNSNINKFGLHWDFCFDPHNGKSIINQSKKYKFKDCIKDFIINEKDKISKILKYHSEKYISNNVSNNVHIT